MAVRGRQGRHAYWRALRLTTVIVSVHCIRYAYAQPTSSPTAALFDADEFADVWLVSGLQASGKSTLARTLQRLGVTHRPDKWSEPLIDTWQIDGREHCTRCRLADVPAGSDAAARRHDPC